VLDWGGGGGGLNWCFGGQYKCIIKVVLWELPVDGNISTRTGAVMLMFAA